MSVIIKRVWNQNKLVNIESLHGMAFQAEDGGHVFEISGVNDAGETVPLSGTVAGVFMRSDRADIALIGAASGGVASVTLTDDCYAVPGRFGLTIFVTEDGKKTAVYAAVGTVSRTSGGGVAGDTPQDVVDLINVIEAAVATIPASYSNLMASIAPIYSSSALYPVGSYAWYDGTLYRCTIPITTAETWTAAHWKAIDVGGDLKKLRSAFISRELSFDLFALYGDGVNRTYNGVTFSWNEQTCSMTGTALTNYNAFSNFLDVKLPTDGILNPPKLKIETSGIYSGGRVEFLLMRNGSIVQGPKTPDSNGFIEFTNTTGDQLVGRVFVPKATAASGAVSIKVYNADPAPFGIHILDNVETGDDLDNIGTGMFVLSDTATYLNAPSFAPCYLLSYIGYNTGLQLAFPYTPGNRYFKNAVMRSKHTDGTWTEWYTQAEFSQTIDEYAVNGVVDIDNVMEPGFYLLSDSYTYQNLPFTSALGFLLVYRSSTVRIQIAIPWTPKTIDIRRRLNNDAWSSWERPGGGGNVYNVTNNYQFSEYEQTVTQTVSPSITADTNNYLAPSGDTTDRTADILAMLTASGVCRLGPGEFYVNGLQMPDRSALIGSGYATRIRLSGTADGFAVKVGSKCLIQNLRISGDDSEPTFGATIGGRHGILWNGSYTQDQTAPDRSIIDNVWIINFSGGGVTCYDTGYGTNNALEITNAYISSCWAGLNISYWSEFHKFTNVRAGSCRIGCVNNGGNNVFTNCDFSSNYERGMLIDNSQGQSPNNSHGSCVGCVFNHTSHAGSSNSGIGIEILNCPNGFMFTGCQIFFSQINLEDSSGIVFDGCNFGLSNCDIAISGGGSVLFANNMFQGLVPITVNNNMLVHFINCYNRLTGEVIEP